MIEIKDIEEKQLQIAYFLSRQQGDSKKFTVSSIYTHWCKWWKEDFVPNSGIMPVLLNDKLKASKKNAGAIQPDFIQYYNRVMESVRDWIVGHYDNESKPRENSDRFKEQLLQLRVTHYLELTRILDDQNKGAYYVMDGVSVNRPCDIGKYWVYKHGENMKHLYYAGTYENTLTYLNETFPA